VKNMVYSMYAIDSKEMDLNNNWNKLMIMV
jgi:hypothetical protein